MQKSSNHKDRVPSPKPTSTPHRNYSTHRNTVGLKNQHHVQGLLVLLQMKQSFLQRDGGGMVKVNQQSYCLVHCFSLNTPTP